MFTPTSLTKQNKKFYNDQKYCDCQFITLINSCIYWDKFYVEPYSDLYNKIAKKAGCIYGGCINLNAAYKLLNVKFVPGKLKLDWVRHHLPVTFQLFCNKGYHSVLCIAVKKNKLCLTNYAKNRLYWLKWDKVKELQNKYSTVCQIL